MPGQKSFNFPDQIGSNGDSPMRIGEIKEHEFVDKDIYVLYSDGVSDNLFIEGPDVRDCIARYLDEEGVVASLSSAADCIAIKAYHAGKNPYLQGPFAIGAKEAGWA